MCESESSQGEGIIHLTRAVAGDARSRRGPLSGAVGDARRAAAPPGDALAVLLVAASQPAFGDIAS
jgi:hypothetical protein